MDGGAGRTPLSVRDGTNRHKRPDVEFLDRPFPTLIRGNHGVDDATLSSMEQPSSGRPAHETAPIPEPGRGEIKTAPKYS